MTGDWGTRGPHDQREWGLGAMGTGNWGLGTRKTLPQYPIPDTQYPIPNY
ncbi:hypothetical protein JYQ62_17885 [Nostoc sp. UHCC 0702]|nr:hypothetical protein JYQ62_17885 [Nostoc sp. UHCC 0702]